MLELTSPNQVSQLLQAHGVRPQKRLGQNFLCDRNTLDNIVRAAQLTADDPVLEIGGGLGVLSLALAKVASAVTVVEVDSGLEPILRENLAPYPHVRVLLADFLRLDIAELFDSAFGTQPGVIVANIPYSITTPILERLINHKTRWRRAVLLTQKEFAQRIVAAPGSDACGSMSLYAQYHCRAEILHTVSRKVFVPQPDVDSSVLALTPVSPGTVAVQNEARMFYIIRSAFGQRRKTLLNALLRAPASFGLNFTKDTREAAERVLARANIDGNRRGETLSLEEYARLSNAFDTE